MNFEVGSNLFSLGIAWLLLHYILPIIIGLALLISAVLMGWYLLRNILPALNKETLFAFLIFGAVILLIVLSGIL